MSTKKTFRGPLDIRWWASASLLLALLLSVWTLSLTVTNNEEHNRGAGRAVDMVNALVQIELSVRNLGIPEGAADRAQAYNVDWLNIYRTYRQRAENLMVEDDHVNGIRETLARCDEIVARALLIRQEVDGLGPDSAEAMQARAAFLDARDRVADDVRQSLATVRSHYSLVGREMEADWRNLRFLVATTCLLVFAIICLFRLYRLEHVHRERVQQELEGNNRRLEVALAEAREASDVRMRILHNVSHEIRTPMNGVLGMTDLLLETDLRAEQRDLAETIQGSGNSLLALIDNMLDLSAISAGKLELKKSAFSLRSVVEDLLELQAEAAARKGLDLNYLVENSVPDAVRGDPDRLRQVLVNLTGNATKFTEHGGVTVRASLVEELYNEAVVRFEVSDTGIGLPPEVLPMIFEPFTQANMAISRRHGGAGLGLAITKELVEGMGGDISAEGNAGAGTTLRFTIRLGRQRVNDPAPPEPLRRRRVLLVDGNAFRREAIHHLVRGWQMRSADALDGLEAQARLEEAAEGGEPFDVVVLDGDLAEMKELQLARTLRAHPVGCSASLLLLVRLGGHFDKEMLDEAGIDMKLSKPVRSSDLRNALTRLVQRQAATAVPFAG